MPKLMPYMIDIFKGLFRVEFL